MRLKAAFNVLRSVIPDHFSEREPGDRLSSIQTLRLAKKYIAALQELLHRSGYHFAKLILCAVPKYSQNVLETDDKH